MNAMTTNLIKGALVAAMLMVAPTHAAHAATITWDGNGNANNSGSWNKVGKTRLSR